MIMAPSMKRFLSGATCFSELQINCKQVFCSNNVITVLLQSFITMLFVVPLVTYCFQISIKQRNVLLKKDIFTIFL